MLKEAISDQKRLVRGLHWARARYFLRARDGVHHTNWKLLIIAGPAPHEEVGCIKELMPRAHITAVDISRPNIEAAIDAGVDEAFVCDLSDFEIVGKSSNQRYYPPIAMQQEEKYDVICLDLTGPANEWLKHVINVYYHTSLAARGVMIITFSYGRDVVERLDLEWSKAVGNGLYKEHLRHLQEVPNELRPRVWFALRAKCHAMDSCLQYVGNKMPMLSCLVLKTNGGVSGPARFQSIHIGDYELAVTAEDLGKVFACPRDRLLELRQRYTRSMAAHKAIATRKKRQSVSPTLLLEHDPGPTNKD